ncbi:hypothetical protein [Alkaliphilus metalliredigens]|nr:hypothetical protein [Alkaliphilus metalliredigens]
MNYIQYVFNTVVYTVMVIFIVRIYMIIAAYIGDLFGIGDFFIGLYERIKRSKNNL